MSVASSLSILENQSQHSVLGSMSILNPDSERHSKSIVADLLLTALIDAFSILVIFLLMSFSSTGEILYIGKMELPIATQAAMLERHPVVKLDEGLIYLEEAEVKIDGLTAALLDLRKQYQQTHPGEEYPGVMTIQADRRVKYEVLSQIVAAASQAGFSDLKFATMMK